MKDVYADVTWSDAFVNDANYVTNTQHQFQAVAPYLNKFVGISPLCRLRDAVRKAVEYNGSVKLHPRMLLGLDINWCILHVLTATQLLYAYQDRKKHYSKPIYLGYHFVCHLVITLVCRLTKERHWNVRGNVQQDSKHNLYFIINN